MKRIVAICILIVCLFSFTGCITTTLSLLGGSEKKTNQEMPTVTPVLPTIPPNNPDDESEGSTYEPEVVETMSVQKLPTIAPATEESVFPTATATPTVTQKPLDTGKIMYVTGEQINVRKVASADSDKITVLSKGTAVTAYEKENGFYLVKLSNGMMGYISTKYLSENDPKKTDTTPTVKPTVAPDTTSGVTKYVTGDSVNVRASGSSSASKVASLVKGKQVIAYTKVGDWTYIRYGENKYGYIATKYLSDTDPTKATPTPTASPKPTASNAPTPTPAPKKSFTDFNVPAAVAEKVDSQTRYLNAAVRDGGFGKEGNTNYCIIETEIEINGQKRFFICYEGTDTEPTNVRISSTKPTA